MRLIFRQRRLALRKKLAHCPDGGAPPGNAKARTHLASWNKRRNGSVASAEQPSAMNKLVLIAAVVFAASPAGAQLGVPNDQGGSSPQGAATGGAQGGSPSQAPSTGVFCIEEMTANFCNVVTGPNSGGYGTRSGSGSGSAAGGTTGSAAAGAGGSASALPPCPAQPPFNELCD